MANFYLDISAVGNEYQAYADTVTTWGVPQDGNGKAGPGHSAAVAIAVIDCTSAQGDGAQTVSILGVTVNNASAGSGTTLAASLVTSINGTATATIATYCQALLPLNKLIFARQNPGAMGQVQVMMRIAGTDWNAIAPTHAGFTTGPTITAFAGGENGPFSYLINTGVAFGKAILGWGVFGAKMGGTVEPSGNDWINVRTSRSAVNLSVSYVGSGGAVYMCGGAVSHRLLFDNGTVWSGDNGQLTLSLTNTSGGSGLPLLCSPNGYAASIHLVSKSPTDYNFRLLVKTTSTQPVSLTTAFSSNNYYFEGVVFEEDAATTPAGYSAYVSHQNTLVTQTRCKYIQKGSRVLANLTSNGSQRWQFVNCIFEYFGLASNVSGIITIVPSISASIEFIGCNFYDRNGVYSVVNPLGVVISSVNTYRVTFDSCTGITDASSSAPAAFWDGDRQLTWENFGPSRDWRIESGCWLAEWRDGQNFATLGALLPRSNTPWSIKVLLRNVGVNIYRQRIARLLGVHLDSTATRTISVKFLAQRLFNVSELGLFVSYLDENSIVRFETTLTSIVENIEGTAANVETSPSDSWTLNGQSGYVAYKLPLTTTYPVKTNSDFNVHVLWTGALVTDQTLFINPEICIV